ncbi:MAG: Fe-S cluster assembly protein SufD [Chloroflexota bacterium]
MTQSDLQTRPGAREVTAESIEKTSRERGEPAWLTTQRLEAWKLAQALPMPNKQMEGWRRTDLSGLDLDTLLGQEATGPAAEAQSTLADNLTGLAGSLRIEDGKVVEQSVAPELAKKGVIVCSLRQALAEKPELVEKHLGRLVTGEESKLVALAAALWDDGLFVYVPNGVGIEQPILSRLATTSGAPSFFRSLIVTGESTDVTVVEDYLSDEAAGEALASGTVELVTGQASRVRYANLQEWNTQTWHFNRLKSETGRDSRIDWLFVAVGGKAHRAEVDAELTGQGAETELVGLIFGDGDQQFDHQILQDHVGNDTRSDSNFKAALGDASSSNFQGMIRVNKTSLRTDSNLENRNLLLSDHSRAESDPRLEILNSDVVRCAHGATVGPLDPEIIFYIQSRGVPLEEARRLVVEAFFEEVLVKIPVESIRDSVWRTIQRKLGREISADATLAGADAWQAG